MAIATAMTASQIAARILKNVTMKITAMVIGVEQAGPEPTARERYLPRQPVRSAVVASA